MEKIDIILWIISGGFAITFGLLFKIDSKIEKLDEKVNDIDRRVCRIEGAISMKECCMLSQDSNRKNVG